MRIYIVLALCALLLALIGGVYNFTQIDAVKCSCKPTISKLNTDFLVCFNGCLITPSNSKLYNLTCSYMEAITVTICNGNRYITTKPSISVHSDYIWVTYFSKIWKIVASISVWLILVVMKVPGLCTISLINQSLNKLIGSKLKKCDICQARYLFCHLDCPTPSFRYRTDYNFVFYILLTIVITATFTKADDNVYNYYRHGNTTEIQLLDKEHYQQDFDVSGYLYTLTVLNSHLVIETVNISEIQSPVSHQLTAQHYSCDGEAGCKAECLAKTGKQPMYTIRKAHDGMSCFFTGATLCGLCESTMKSIGYKVATTKVSPYIDIEVVHGNKTEILKIREFSKFIHEPYYVKPIEPVALDSIDLFINGPNVYAGQICSLPSYGCFGPNYVKDGRSYRLISPKVVDPMTYDREVVLEHCIDPGNSDINSLQKLESVYQNNTIVKPHEFGMLSIGIPYVGKLVGDFCEKPVLVESIDVVGCYDCQSGIEVNIKYKRPDVCGQMKCSIGRVTYEYFVDIDSNQMSIHSFFDKENVEIVCNNQKGKFKLEHSKDTDYYKTSNGVHGSDHTDFNFLSHLPNLIYNPKAVITTMLLILVTSYMVYSLIKQMIFHYIKIRSDRRTREYKRTDNVDIFKEQSEELVIVTGDSQ